MDKLTRDYRSKEILKVYNEQAESGEYLPTIQLSSGNGVGKTKVMNITKAELVKIRVILTAF